MIDDILYNVFSMFDKNKKQILIAFGIGICLAIYFLFFNR